MIERLKVLFELKNKQRRSGFALIVVLGALSVITLLFAIVETRLFSRVERAHVERLILKTSHESGALLRYAADYIDEDENVTELDVSWNDQPGKLRFVDVGGLIDLNTANPTLISAFFALQGVGEENQVKFRKWRQAPNRLQSVNDIGRVFEIDHEAAFEISRFTTVHSGRFGISEQVAPEALVAQLRKSLQQSRLPEEWLSAPTNSKYLVEVVLESGQELVLGTVQVSGTGMAARILEVR